MNIFVASWFFPPSTSSEGLVTYKLLRNSEHNYYVCSANSDNWSYKASTNLNSETNIKRFDVTTDIIDDWVEFCIKTFEELSCDIEFDCIMTRSMPPESILVGKAVKEKHKAIKWIASFGDPIANNPYEIQAYIDDNNNLSIQKKNALKIALRSNNEEDLEKWEKTNDDGIRLMCKLKRWENYARRTADMIIAPTSTQLKYMMGSDHWMPKFLVVPHSYDKQFYSHTDCKHDDSFVNFIYTGYSDRVRSLTPFIRAVRELRESGSPAFNQIHFTIVGNTPDYIKHMVLNYYLDDVFSFVEGVSYYESLRMVEEADWALHVDASFACLEEKGSIFFAGKLADYIGAGKPILALTDIGSPAYKMVTETGGEVCSSADIHAIAMKIEQIVAGEIKTERNRMLVESLDAVNVAKRFDKAVEKLCRKTYISERRSWPEIDASSDKKILTVCIPSYNAQVFLDRCIYSLINHDMAPFMEVLVVNDGSSDFTPMIGAEYEKRYPGIVRVINKENGGHGSTINVAIKQAKGKYFKNVDSDDWVDSKNLAGLIKYLFDCDDLDAISSDYDEVDLMTGEETPMRAGKSIEYGRVYNFTEINPDDAYFTIHSITFKTDILKKMSMELQHHTFFVDCEYILFPVPYIHRFTFLKPSVYKYSRGNPEQSVDIVNMVKRYDHHDRVVKRCIEYGENADMDRGQKAYYDATLRRFLWTHFALSTVYDSNQKRGMERAKEFYEYLKKKRPDLATYSVKQFEFLRTAYMFRFNPNAIRVEQTCRIFSQKTVNKVKRIVIKVGLS